MDWSWTCWIKALAKLPNWRYETVAASFSDLLKYRDLNRHVRFDWFANTKEPETVRKAFMAMHNDEWWAFLFATSREIFNPSERARHWGMVCECPEHQAQRMAAGDKSIHIACWWNSRRSSKGEEFISNFIGGRRERYMQLTEVEFDNYPKIFKRIPKFAIYFKRNT